jgi:uncharacterized sulfatase
LIVAGPGVSARGRASTRTVELLDIYPTLAQLAGVKPPASLQGRSLQPLVANPEAAWDRPALTQVRRGSAADQFMGYSLRTEKWRYTEWDEGKRGVQLYDLNADPSELKNLATDPMHAKTVAELRALLRATKTRSEQ